MTSFRDTRYPKKHPFNALKLEPLGAMQALQFALETTAELHGNRDRVSLSRRRRKTRTPNCSETRTLSGRDPNVSDLIHAIT